MSTRRAFILVYGLALLALILGLLPGPASSPLDWSVLMQIRLPKVLFAFVAGAALAISGLLYQTFLRNPLAEPYILGVSGASSLGAVMPLVIGGAAFAGPFARSLGAFAGGCLVLLLVAKLGGLLRPGRSTVLLLFGISLNLLCGVLLRVLVSLSLDPFRQAEFTLWMSGLLPSPKACWTGLWMVGVPLLVLAGAAMIRHRLLDIWLLPQDEQVSLGANQSQIRTAFMVMATLLVAMVSAFAGTLAFVGLVVPHLVRRYLGASHRALLPACLLVGGALMVAADGVVRSGLLGVHLPVGAVTGVVGAPIFIFLLLKSEGRSW